MKVTEKTRKQIDEIASKLNLPTEEKSEFVDKLFDEATDLAAQASSNEAAEAAFLDYLYQNYRDQVTGTSAEKDALALRNKAPSEEVSLASKPSDEAFMKAMGAKNMKELLNWDWHNHWSKMPYGDFKARAEQAGLDPKSVLAWLQQQQTAYDRGEALEGRDGIGDWLISAGLGFALPRTKEALKAGREPNAGDWGVDLGALGLQALPLGALALPVKLGGKVASYAIANAAVPYAEEGLDALFNDDPYRKDFSNTDALIGTGVNMITPAIIKRAAQFAAQKLAGFGKSPKIANAIEDFVSDPIEQNKEYLKKAQQTVDKGMAPSGFNEVNPRLAFASPQEYEDALDVLVLEELRKAGFFIPEMRDPELRRKLVRELLEHAEMDPDVMLKSDMSRRNLRAFGKENPGIYANPEENLLDARFYDVHPSLSSLHYAAREANKNKGRDVLEDFGTVLVDGKPRIAVQDISIDPAYANTGRIKDFKKKYGFDPEERHFTGKNQTAEEQFAQAGRLFEGADILSKPTNFDRALDEVLTKPENQRLAFYGPKHHAKDLARLGLISLGTNKLGRGENVKRVPNVGPQLYELMKQEIAKNEAEKAEIEYYLNDPVTLRLWEFNYDQKKNFQPRGSDTMRKAYEIWKAQKEQK